VVGGVSLPLWMWLASALPAVAQDLTPDFGAGGNADPKSYWTALGLFLLSVPGARTRLGVRALHEPRLSTWPFAGSLGRANHSMSL
jgi:hypothetical protein